VAIGLADWELVIVIGEGPLAIAGERIGRVGYFS
jgi:hypothetical protein